MTVSLERVNNETRVISFESINNDFHENIYGVGFLGSAIGIACSGCLGYFVGNYTGQVLMVAINTLCLRNKARAEFTHGQLAIQEGRIANAKVHYLNAALLSGEGRLIRDCGNAFEELPGRNLPLAAKCYQIALERWSSYPQAQDDLNRLIASQALSANDAITIGLIYHKGEEVKIDPEKALRWYERAKVIDPGNAIASRNIGLLYEISLHNLPLAIRHYQSALEHAVLPYTRAQEDLDRIFISPTVSANDAISIGVMYHNRLGAANLRKALEWYGKAIILEPRNGTAMRNLGVMHENGQHFPGNPVQAVRLYLNAYYNGCQLARDDFSRIYHAVGLTRKERKAIATESIIVGVSRDPSLPLRDRLTRVFQETDARGFTPLRRAINDRLYKQIARLKICGGNNTADIAPLTAAVHLKIANLQRQITDLVRNLREPAPVVLFNQALSVIDRNQNPEVISQAIFNEMYQNELLKPLMDMAQLATLGCHRSSQRRKYIEPDGYDSDDDDNEALRDDQRLSIVFNWHERTVENMHYYPGADQAHGVYIFPGNIVFVAARLEGTVTPAFVRGIMIHELTHFLANEVFGNQALPYEANDVTNLAEFRAITNDLFERRNDLDPILQAVFTSPAYNTGNAEVSHHQELIVRVAQMIVTYEGTWLGGDGLHRLRNQVPRLLSYYENIFLPAIRRHIEKCKSVALAGWSEELLREAIF